MARRNSSSARGQSHSKNVRMRRERRVHLGQVGLALLRARDGGRGGRVRLGRRRRAPQRPRGRARRDRRVRERERRVVRDGLAVEVERCAPSVFGRLVETRPAGQVGVVRARVRRRPPAAEPRLQLDRQGTRDAPRDVRLQREDVREAPVEAVGPQLRLVGHLDESRRDADAVALAPHAALDEVVDTQRTADRVHRLAASLELHGGRARDHPQPMRARAAEHRDHLFGHALREALLLRVGADALERQHREHESRRRDERVLERLLHLARRRVPLRGIFLQAAPPDALERGRDAR